jgi:hypothetical protein
MNDIQRVMIEKFMCPGCVCGSSTSDGCFKEENFSLACGAHVAGTNIYPLVGNINLGLPNGFNRNGPIDKTKLHSIIRLYETLPSNHYDKFNVPVWAMEYEGYLLVRVYLPRTNMTFVDVIMGARITDMPLSTMNVSEFYEEIN